ncbi:hypothetical protein niasHS_005363 [Heterodera schachtii]|uniref:Saposin B-type domain-containing protein n=1 Tax=Heterodera schachtii TaxID=97005 RepID=A0ABD2J947_HETSC
METNFVNALSDEEMCDQCQKVLYRTFLYYRVQTTKRFLRHKLKHLCKRYFEYRRHCLITMMPRVDLIWVDMEKVLNEENSVTPEFKPYGTCAAMKECAKVHRPLTTFGPDDGMPNGVAAAAVDTGETPTPTTTAESSSHRQTIGGIESTAATSSSWSTTETTTTTATADDSENESSLLMLDFF